MLVTGSEDATARMWSTRTDDTECIGVLKWVAEGAEERKNCVQSSNHNFLQRPFLVHKRSRGVGDLRSDRVCRLHHPAMGHGYMRVPFRLRGSHGQDPKVNRSPSKVMKFQRFHFRLSNLLFRLIVTSDFIFSSSYDKTIKAWVFDTTTIGPGQEAESCIRDATCSVPY